MQWERRLSYKVFSVSSCYLTRAPWAASSQGMQDDSGAKSANWLCGYVSKMSTSFSSIFPALHQFEASRLSLRSAALQN